MTVAVNIFMFYYNMGLCMTLAYHMSTHSYFGFQHEYVFFIKAVLLVA